MNYTTKTQNSATRNVAGGSHGNIDHILSRLQKVRKTARAWVACCPAHADKSPSLSIRDTGSTVLLYCHAGCEYRDICDALGIGPLETDRDIMATSRGREIAKLSRRSHKLEAAFLVEDYGLSATTADRLVLERLRRSQLPEVQEFLKAGKGKEVSVIDYFVVEIGLDRAVAVDLLNRLQGEISMGANVSEVVRRELAADVADGASVLAAVESFISRFVAYPSEAARIAHTLWIAHTHLMDHWDSTPRIAFLSPEPGSGKSRALEVTEPLVPRAVHAVNTTPAYLFRKVSDENGPPTILYDEVDTVFGPKAKDNEDIRGMLNAGHRRGATAGRCVTRGKIIETEELPAYCAVALAGLDDLPDTIMTRCVVIRMRRRSPNERIEPWRLRKNGEEAEPIADDLERWASSVLEIPTWPEMPKGVEDRNADVWEALLSVADLAGGEWPSRARVAAVALVASAADRTGSLGVQLLVDLKIVFNGCERLTTDKVIEQLLALPESAWSDLRGKPLDARGLSTRLRKYEIKPKQLRVGERNVRGYERSDFKDPWSRYLPVEDAGIPSPEISATSATSATVTEMPLENVAVVGSVADKSQNGHTGADEFRTGYDLCQCGGFHGSAGEKCQKCGEIITDILQEHLAQDDLGEEEAMAAHRRGEL